MKVGSIETTGDVLVVIYVQGDLGTHYIMYCFIALLTSRNRTLCNTEHCTLHERNVGEVSPVVHSFAVFALTLEFHHLFYNIF